MSLTPAPPASQLRLVLTVLAVAPAVFAGIAFLMRPEEPSEVSELLSYVVLGLGASELLAGFFLRKQMVRPALDDLETSVDLLNEDRIPAPLFSRAIVTAALATGVAVFSGVTLLLGGPNWLFLLNAVCLVVVLLQLPNPKRLVEELRDRARG